MVYFTEYSKRVYIFRRILDQTSTEFFLSKMFDLRTKESTFWPSLSQNQKINFHSCLIVQRNYFSRSCHEHIKAKCAYFQSIEILNFCSNVKSRMKTCANKFFGTEYIVSFCTKLPSQNKLNTKYNMFSLNCEQNFKNPGKKCSIRRRRP